MQTESEREWASFVAARAQNRCGSLLTLSLTTLSPSLASFLKTRRTGQAVCLHFFVVVLVAPPPFPPFLLLLYFFLGFLLNCFGSGLNAQREKFVSSNMKTVVGASRLLPYNECGARGPTRVATRKLLNGNLRVVFIAES